MNAADRWRLAPTTIAAACLLLIAVVSTSVASEPLEEHPVVGRFSITSEAGGAVWAFQPSGALILIGPGELVAEGTWTAGPGEREFDARVDVDVSGQVLEVLGQVSPDGDSVAVYVQASDPERPDDWTPWPPVSQLVGVRSGMVPVASPPPSPAPDCVRPDWIDGAVDWDRCDATMLTPAAGP